MSAEKGRDFVLKVGDGATSEEFTTIGGAKLVGFNFTGEDVDISAPELARAMERLQGQRSGVDGQDQLSGPDNRQLRTLLREWRQVRRRIQVEWVRLQRCRGR